MAAAELLKWNYDICLTDHLCSGDPSVSAPAVRMFVPPCAGFFDKPCTDFFGKPCTDFFDIQTFNVEALVEFVTDHSTPLVFHYNTSTFIYKKYLLDTENEKVMLYINFEDKDAHTLKSTYLDVAKKYRGQGLIFMLGDLEDSKRLSWFFGPTTSKYPLIVIKNYEKQIYAKLFLMPKQLETWVEDYKAGKVAPFGVSEPIPVQNAAGHVQVVVADTFWDMVMAGDKNVLLELYRPEFKNCAEVAAVLDEVAEYFKDEKRDDVVFAKLDESTNDIRSKYTNDLNTVGDSPTLYLIPPSEQLIMRYDVDIITKYDVIMFIEECGYNPNKRSRKPSEDIDY
jgi:protein disulfide-isomerase A1